MAERPYRTSDGQRLVWWHENATPDHWYKRFREGITRSHQRVAENNQQYYFKRFAQYLPKEGKILEAGSGDGAVVAYLLREGYDIEGVDYSDALIDTVLDFVPELPVRCGNVLDLDVPDGYYNGYISLGVIEHRQEGCQPFLQEARRIVAQDGILVFTVPYFNLIRRIKLMLGLYRKPDSDHQFYQYAFSKKYFRQELEKAGFEFMCFNFYGTRNCVKDEFPWLLKLPGFWRISDSLAKLDRFGFMSHMIMAVVRRR